MGGFGLGLGFAGRVAGTAQITLEWSHVIKILASLCLLALFAFNQPFEGRGYVSDVDAATFPAWVFVDTGSFELSGHQEHNHWFVTTENGVFSNRAPGVIGFATVGYIVAKPWLAEYSALPGNLMAIVTSWLAVILVAASAERLHRGLWVPTLVLFGMGTATWSISANQLWPHGPAQLSIAFAVWLLLRRRELASGLWFAVAVLVRPPTVVLGLGVAVAKAARDRSWAPLLRIGAPTLAAAAAFLGYTRLVFGSWTPVASYEAVGGFYGVTGVGERVTNVLSATVLPRHGVLMWSAWIVVCLVIAYRGRLEGVPAWLWSTPLIAVAYIVLHSMMEVASGALPYNYRYPLEAVTLAAPFLLAALPRLTETALLRASLVVAGSFAVFLQACFVFASACWLIGPDQRVCAMFG